MAAGTIRSVSGHRTDHLISGKPRFCRLVAESGGDERVSRLRYLFATAFSSSLMTTVGYEYGFRRPMHVVEPRPEYWEQPGIIGTPMNLNLV